MAVTIKILGDEASVEKALAKMRASMKLTAEQIDGKAKLVVEKSTLERENLEKLAATYRATADAAVKGSATQVAAAAKAAEAEARLAKQSTLAAGETAKASLSLGALGGSAKSTEKLVSKLSGSMALWFGAPALGAGIASAIHATQQFSATMEQLHTQAGASQVEVAKMTTALQQLAPKVGMGPEELAQGLYHIESTGMRGAKALRVMQAAAEGARIGNANLEDVTNALNAVVVSGIKGAQNYQEAMGSLNATVGAGDMRMQDLADAMGTGLPAKAAIFGLSLKDVNAALAVFGDNNIRGAHAGTLLGQAIRIMGAPSKAASKELAGLGLASTQLADDMRNGGLPTAIEDLKKHMDALGLTASQQAEVLTRAFGGKQSGGVLIMINQLERLKQKEKEVGDGAHSFASDWVAYTKQSQFQTQRLQAELETLRIVVGNAVLPAFTSATKALSEWVYKENQSGAITRDVKEAVSMLTSAVKLAGTAIHDLDEITGSFKNTLELLLALKVASSLSGWVSGFQTVGAGATAATTKVEALRFALANVAKMGAIGVAIDVAIRYHHFLDQQAKHIVAQTGNSVLLDNGQQYALGAGRVSGTVTGGPGGGLSVFAPGYSTDPTGKYRASHAAASSYVVDSGVDMTDENAMIPVALKALAGQGYKVDVTSGYRSYAQQAALYARYVNSGFNIKYIAAKPGQSNHETGNAVDVYVNGKPVDQSPGALAFLKKYGLVADVAGDHEHLDLTGYGGSSAATGKGSATQAQIDALVGAGGSGSGKKTKAELAAERAKTAAQTLHATLQQLAGKVKSDVAEVNTDMRKGILDDATGKALNAQAKKVTGEIGKGTKAALPGIRTDISALHAAIQLQLSLAGEKKKLKSESADIDTLVKAGVISPAAVAQLRGRAKQIGVAIAHGTKDSLPSIRQAITDLKSQIGEWTAQATDVSNWNADIATLKTDVANQMRQAVGTPEVYASPEALAAAEQGAAKITGTLADRFITPAVRKKLESQLKSLQSTIKSGMSGLLQTISDDETKFQTAWGRIASAQDTAFDKVTQAHLADMQAKVQTALAAMQVMISGFGAPFLFGGGITQTPSQIAAAALQKQHDDQQAADQLAADRAQLAKDQGPGGDPTQIVADQKAVDEDLYEAQLKALQAQGDLEQQAAQDQLQAAQDKYTAQQQAAQDAYSTQRDLLRQAMDDQVQTIVDGMTNGTIATQDGFTQLAKVYADNGVPLGNAAFVLAGKIYNGLADGGIQAATDLIQKLQDEIKNLATMTGAKLPDASSASGGGSGLSVGAAARAGIGTGGALQSVYGLSTGALERAGIGFGGASPNSIPGFATGVRNFRGGYAIVGEEGPELVHIPGGSDVISHSHLRALAAGTLASRRSHTAVLADAALATAAGAPGGDVHIHFHGGTFIGSEPRKVARELAPHVRSELIKTGRRNVNTGLT
jgi:TP901 family phage tail tape measure protein